MSPLFTSCHWTCRTNAAPARIKVLLEKSALITFWNLHWSSFFCFLSSSPESVNSWERDTVCPTVQRHNELELPHAAAGGDPQPLHLRGEAVAHRAHRLPHRSHCCWGRVHLLRRTEQVCLQLGPAGLRECLLRCLCPSISRPLLGLPDYLGGDAFSHVHGLCCQQDRPIRRSQRRDWLYCRQNRRRGLHAQEAQENLLWSSAAPGHRGDRGGPGGRSYDLWGARDWAP